MQKMAIIILILIVLIILFIKYNQKHSSNDEHLFNLPAKPILKKDYDVEKIDKPRVTFNSTTFADDGTTSKLKGSA